MGKLKDLFSQITRLLGRAELWTGVGPVSFQIEPLAACLSSFFKNPVEPVGHVCADSKLICNHL